MATFPAASLLGQDWEEEGEGWLRAWGGGAWLPPYLGAVEEVLSLICSWFLYSVRSSELSEAGFR